MKTWAAVLWGLNQDWKVEEIDLHPPKAGEVLVKMAAAGLCHSDEHFVTGDMVVPEEMRIEFGMPDTFPIIGGHEGAGVVVEVGPGVTSVRPGDHVSASFIPSCGRCRYCSTGRQNLCDLGAAAFMKGQITDGTSRHFCGEHELNLMAKREKAMELGATQTYASMEEAIPAVMEMTWGQMADRVIMTPGVLYGELMAGANALCGKGGTMVVTAIAPITQTEASVNLFQLAMWQKEIKGTIFGSLNPRADIPRLLDLYRQGQLKLDELVTQRYSLDEINQGYQDMRAGINIRGVIVFD